jgi:MFS family permease
MMKVMHPRVQTLIGGLGLILPLILCSYTTNYYLFMFLYSFGTGFSFGILYMPALKHSWVYFPSHKGLVSGTILSFYSIGSIIAVIVTQYVANPENVSPMFDYKKDEYIYPPESEVTQAVPRMLRALAWLYGAMIILSCVLISSRRF